MLERFILDNLNRYTFVMRLHPNMVSGFATNDGANFVDYFNKTYPQNTIEWKVATEMPLPLLLSNVDLHITWNSSVCIEAALIGVKTLALDFELLEAGLLEKYYENIVQSGHLDEKNAGVDDIKLWVFDNLGEKLNPYENHAENYEKVITLIRGHLTHE